MARRKKAARKATDTYSVIIKHDGSQSEAIEYFMNQLEQMFRQEFKEYGSVTVMKELDIKTLHNK